MSLDDLWLESPVRCPWCGAELRVRRFVPFDVIHRKPTCREFHEPAHVEVVQVVARAPFELVLSKGKESGRGGTVGMG